MASDLQSLCELGQTQLMAMSYLGAIATLERAEQFAWETEDFDTLSRLYFPLQEARRQKRQRCGEGVVRLDLVAKSPDDATVDPEKIVASHPHGQLLIAGWASIEPARRVRHIAKKKSLYLETFLAAVYPLGNDAGTALVVVPTDDVALPKAGPWRIDELVKHVSPHSIVQDASALSVGDRKGTTATFAETMAVWEMLAAPFLAMADATTDPVQKMKGYRRAIEVDEACELAHQNLAMTARQVDRERRPRRA
jgi:hypothetical protein